MRRWLKTLSDLCSENTRVVLVTVVDVKGSTPRERGARMLVTKRHSMGTIGGGQLEYQCIKEVRELLRSDLRSRVRYFKKFLLGPNLGQCCGGAVNLMIEVLDHGHGWIGKLRELNEAGSAAVLATPLDKQFADKLVLAQNTDYSHRRFANLHYSDLNIINRLFSANLPCTLMLGDRYLFELIPANPFHITIFGAGHVGRALVNILATLPCRINWIDSRAEMFPDRIPENVETIIEEKPEYEVDDMPQGSYFLVLTHNHQLDQRICERILKRNDFTYFGLIGSRSKRRKFEQRFRRRGMDQPRIDRMVCPIGIDGIDSKHPESIAISVAAEIMQYRDQSQKSSGIDNGRVSCF